MTATCAVCGKPFEARRRDAAYCSPRCRQRALRTRSVTETPTDTRDEASPVLGGETGRTEAIAPRPRASWIPDVEPCRSPVYAHGSLHGPTYDAKGNQARSPVPAIVGHLTADGRFERDGGHRR